MIKDIVFVLAYVAIIFFNRNAFKRGNIVVMCTVILAVFGLYLCMYRQVEQSSPVLRVTPKVVYMINDDGTTTRCTDI